MSIFGDNPFNELDSVAKAAAEMNIQEEAIIEAKDPKKKVEDDKEEDEADETSSPDDDDEDKEKEEKLSGKKEKVTINPPMDESVSPAQKAIAKIRAKRSLSEAKVYKKGDKVKIDSDGDSYDGKSGTIHLVGKGRHKDMFTVSFKDGQIVSYHKSELVNEGLNEAKKKELDPVNKKELKKSFADRAKEGDGDIDNDGDEDDSDKFLHKKRKAISKSIEKDMDEGCKNHTKEAVQDGDPVDDDEDEMTKDLTVKEGLDEKTLTPAEKKKKEEIVKNLKNKDMDGDGDEDETDVAIAHATATKIAKKVAEERQYRSLENTIRNIINR